MQCINKIRYFACPKKVHHLHLAVSSMYITDFDKFWQMCYAGRKQSKAYN